MKTPTLEEVKEYFKNAKEVRCLWDGKIYNISSWKLYKDECGFRYAENKKAENERFCGVFGINDYAKFAEIISYKDTYTVSKDFILEAHESACSTFQTKIENQFPELFPKVELEVGKWYVAYWCDIKYIVCIESIDIHINTNGFNITESGRYTDLPFDVDYDYKWTLATKEEVETALIAEAKKRGYENNKIYCIVGNVDTLSDKLIYGVFRYENNDLIYQMYGVSYTIFSKGKWAEIISEPIELSLDQIAEKFGVDVSQIKIKK